MKFEVRYFVNNFAQPIHLNTKRNPSSVDGVEQRSLQQQTGTTASLPERRVPYPVTRKKGKYEMTRSTATHLDVGRRTTQWRCARRRHSH